MLLALVAAAWSIAAVAPVEPLRVPYVPQTDALCGGAAAAMVFRYWGDAHADVAQFGALVERRAGGAAGIAADVLTRAVVDRGWQTGPPPTSLEALRDTIEAGRPVIVLLADRRDLYHYVVVVGADAGAIIVHDPSWGPSRAVKLATFESSWAAARYWSLVVVPSETRSGASSAVRSVDELPAVPATAACDVMLNQAIRTVSARGLDSADGLLAPVREQCPASAGPLRELAGVRFAQQRYAQAAALARDALSKESDDAYASEVLGSSLLMLDDPEGALRAWNKVGKPRLDMVNVEGAHHTRYQAVAEALQLKPNALLTADAFAQAQHRLNELPDRSQARLDVRPQPDGYATVDVAIAERAGRPRGAAGWSAVAIRAAVDRESSVSLPGFSGQGEVWTASWRWYQNRPRVAIGFAAPRVGGLFGVWRVEGVWEAETYAIGPEIRREVHNHAGLTVSDWMTGNLRYALNAGADVWQGGRRTAAAGGSLERRWLSDRLALAGDATTWIPADGGSAFSAAGVRLTARSASDARRWIFEGTTGGDRVSEAAPLALWPGAGEGRTRRTLLRAHPLLDDGVIDLGAASAFGRSMIYGNGEAQRWLAFPRPVGVAVATFVDLARSMRRAAGGTVSYADVGAGLRIRVPGWGRVLRLDVAHGLTDGANAFTVGLGF